MAPLRTATVLMKALLALMLLMVMILFWGKVVGSLAWATMVLYWWLRSTPKQAHAPSRQKAGVRLPAHLHGLSGMLEPLLAQLQQALLNPGAEMVQLPPASLDDLLRGQASALKQMYAALLRFAREDVEAASTSASQRAEIRALVTVGVHRLLTEQGRIAASEARLPADPDFYRLRRNARANLERLTMWLARVLFHLRQPERIQEQPNSQIELMLTFRFPETLEELSRWMDSTTDYDAAWVRRALQMPASQPLSSHSAPSFLHAAPSRPRPRGRDWVTPFLVGWIVGDALFDDDDKA